jgi:hypothetical protein
LTRLLDTQQLNDLLSSLGEPGALIELAVLAACLALAWGVVRLIRGPEAPDGSIWFGRIIFTPPNSRCMPRLRQASFASPCRCCSRSS